jgi:diacylglycerol kinase
MKDKMTNHDMEGKKRFSLIARIRSFNNGWRGLGIFFKTTHNSWGQIVCALLAIYLGFILHISSTEWVLVVFSIGIVMITEAINTAIEIDIDLTSPEHHPFARDTKDVAAAAVILATFVAGITGLIIFLPKIF